MIVFINTPTDRYPDEGRGSYYTTIPPMGLGSVATIAGKIIGKDKVKLIDAEYEGLSPVMSAKEAVKFNPREVGFNITEPNRSLVIETAQEIVRLDQNIMLLFGGPEVILDTDGIMNDIEEAGLKSNTIFLVTGEGEKPIKEYLLGTDITTIAGIAYFDNEQRIIKEGVYLTEEELDEERLDRDLFRNDPNFEDGRVESYILTSRGCPFPCNYCAAGEITKKSGLKPRVRTIASVREELQEALATGVNHVRFVDDLFLLSKRRILEITRMFREMGINAGNFGYEANGRVSIMSSLPDKTWDELQETGLKELEIGVESGSPRMLELMNKRITPEQVLTTARQAFKRRIGVKGFFMAGYYQETTEDLDTTIELVKLLKMEGGSLFRASMVPVKDYHGTVLFDQMKYTREFLEANGARFGDEVNVNLASFLKIDPEVYRDVTQVLEGRTRYNAFPTIAFSGESFRPIAISELTGGATTQDVMCSLAEVALISSGQHRELNEARITKDRETYFPALEMQRSSILERR